MTTWLDPVRRALDDSSTPRLFFFRDDDAGWADKRLLELLDLFADRAVPIDVAAIPAELSSSIAPELRKRLERESDRLAIHQHGLAHRNYERDGLRKCEFGPIRTSVQQAEDLRSGKRKLFDLLGPEVKPIFTPPWNRCTTITGNCLLETGFRILSRDASAPPLNLKGLFELPIQIDWFGKQHGVRRSQLQLGAEVARSIRSKAAVGVMLHHAVMDQEELEPCAEMLALLAAHENADCGLMEHVVRRLSDAGPIALERNECGLREAL
jgi:hypothetical protein